MPDLAQVAVSVSGWAREGPVMRRLPGTHVHGGPGVTRRWGLAMVGTQRRLESPVIQAGLPEAPGQESLPVPPSLAGREQVSFLLHDLPEIPRAGSNSC